MSSTSAPAPSAPSATRSSSPSSPGAVMSKQQFEVGGVLYDRPFKIRRLNHFGITLDDVPGAVPFVRDVLGFQTSEELDLRSLVPAEWLEGVADPRLYFFRHNS